MLSYRNLRKYLTNGFNSTSSLRDRFLLLTPLLCYYYNTPFTFLKYYYKLKGNQTQNTTSLSRTTKDIKQSKTFRPTTLLQKGALATLTQKVSLMLQSYLLQPIQLNTLNSPRPSLPMKLSLIVYLQLYSSLQLLTSYSSSRYLQYIKPLQNLMQSRHASVKCIIKTSQMESLSLPLYRTTLNSLGCQSSTISNQVTTQDQV